MTLELFSTDPLVGPTHPARGSDTSSTSRSLTERLFSRSNTQYSTPPLVSYSQIKTRPNPYTHARIHPYSLQTGHRSQRGIVFEVSTHGSDPGVEPPRVKINGLACQGDPTRMKPVSHGSIGRWRVGLGQEILKSRGSGRVGPRFFQLSRVGAGRVNTFFACKVSYRSISRSVELTADLLFFVFY